MTDTPNTIRPQPLGKRVEEMTRQELISALDWYMARHDALTSPDATLTRMVGMSERIARGI